MKYKIIKNPDNKFIIKVKEHWYSTYWEHLYSMAKKHNVDDSNIPIHYKTIEEINESIKLFCRLYKTRTKKVKKSPVVVESGNIFEKEFLENL